VRLAINVADYRVARRSIVHGVIAAGKKVPEVYNMGRKKRHTLGEAKFSRGQITKKLPVPLTLLGFGGPPVRCSNAGCTTSVGQKQYKS
jgi:hypothetical protein